MLLSSLALECCITNIMGSHFTLPLVERNCRQPVKAIYKVVVFWFQVQSDHYEEFFAPELDKHGYQALFKRKTNEVVSQLCVPRHSNSFFNFISIINFIVNFRFTVEIPIQLMVAQHFFVEIDFHMSKNMRSGSALNEGCIFL